MTAKREVRAAAASVLRRNRRRHAYASVCIMGHQSCEALVPLLLGLAIDTAVGPSDPLRLVLSLVSLVALFVALTMCWRWAARFGYGASIDEAHRTRSALASGFLRGSGRGGLTRGEQLSLSTSDADLSAQTVTYSSSLFGAAAALIVSCTILLGINPSLGLLLIGVAVGTALALGALSPIITRRTTKQQETLAAAAAWATDALGGLRVLHGLRAQRSATRRYAVLSRGAVRAGTRAGNAQGLQFGATSLAGTVVMGVAVIFAGRMALEGSISIGAFIAAVGAAQFMTEPLSHIGFFLQMRAATHAGLARILAASEKSPSQPAGQPNVERWAGTTAGLVLHLQDPVRELRIGHDEFLAILADAPSLGRLRAAFDPDVPAATTAENRAPTALAATLDGVPLQLLEPVARRLALHFEPHRVDLFGGSVAQNLALGGPRENQGTSITEVLEAAHANDFVAALEHGVDAQIRERGASLSGGQRQRLALARALHADAAFLVLDHPTSGVDSATENSIASGVRRLRHSAGAKRTTIILTTSPALLAAADRVLFLRADAPALHGTHDQLLARHDDYRSEIHA